MSFEAAWGTDDPRYHDTGRRMTVDTADDVDLLITELTDPGSGAAHLVHHERPMTIDDEGMAGPPGAEIIDHDVLVGVGHDYGYLSYFSPEFDYAVAELVGDPNSPKLIADPMEFDSGTGVPIETLAKALKEFLKTAQRPTCVEWQSAI